jgi:hypothetical protein
MAGYLDRFEKSVLSQMSAHYVAEASADAFADN